MKAGEPINVAVAESSVIVRSGLVAVFRKMLGVKINVAEITSMESLHHCVRGCHLDVVFVNPSFGGWFNLKEFKSQYPNLTVKFVSILCAVTDMNMVKDYDSSINLYDDQDVIEHKIIDLMQIENSDQEEEQETLSQREKEIICCVVKGMTNKEIATQLYISVHTVMTHRRNISRKLQIHSPAGLTIYAIVNKLVELKEVKM